MRPNLRMRSHLYYQMAGWDDNGVPTRAKLAELNLTWISEADKATA